MGARDIVEWLLLVALWGASFLFMRVASPEYSKGVMEYDSPRPSGPSGTQGRATLNHQPQNPIWTTH